MFCFERGALGQPAYSKPSKKMYLHIGEFNHSEVTVAMCQGGLATAQVDEWSWFHSHNADFIGMQSARIVELQKLSPKFQKKAYEAKKYSWKAYAWKWQWSQNGAVISVDLEIMRMWNICWRKLPCVNRASVDCSWQDHRDRAIHSLWHSHLTITYIGCWAWKYRV